MKRRKPLTKIWMICLLKTNQPALKARRKKRKKEVEDPEPALRSERFEEAQQAVEGRVGGDGVGPGGGRIVDVEALIRAEWVEGVDHYRVGRISLTEISATPCKGPHHGVV